MKKRQIIILSDLWGDENSKWLSFYTQSLKKKFELIIYDSRQLAKISNVAVIEKEMHQQFINFGISNAIQQLLKLHPDVAIIIGFSVGGTIAWKAGIKGLKCSHYFLVSATRLRYETQRPAGNLHLLYGELDSFRPNDEWSKDLLLHPTVLEGKSHEMYQDKDVSDRIVESILKIKW